LFEFYSSQANQSASILFLFQEV